MNTSYLSCLLKVQEVQSALLQLLAYSEERGQLQLEMPEVWKLREVDLSSAETHNVNRVKVFMSTPDKVIYIHTQPSAVHKYNCKHTKSYYTLSISVRFAAKLLYLWQQHNESKLICTLIFTAHVIFMLHIKQCIYLMDLSTDGSIFISVCSRT